MAGNTIPVESKTPPPGSVVESTETDTVVDAPVQIVSLPKKTDIPRDAQYSKVFDQVHALGQLQEGWNSYRGAPIGEEARRRAVAFLATVLTHLDEPVPAPSVGPSPDGGVVFRWDTGDYEVEIVFLREGGEYSVARRGREDLLEEGAIGRPESIVRDLIKKYVQS